MKKKYFFIFLSLFLFACKEQVEESGPTDPCGPMFCCLPPYEEPPEEMTYQDWSSSGMYQLTFFKSGEETIVKLETFGAEPISMYKIFELSLFFDISYQVTNFSHCYTANESITADLPFYAVKYIADDERYCEARLAESGGLRLQIDSIYHDILNTGYVDELNEPHHVPQ